MSEIMLFSIIAIVILDLYLLGTSRLDAMIRIVAIQGFILGTFPFLTHSSGKIANAIVLTIISIGIKGITIPILLRRVVRTTEVAHDRSPYVGHTFSVICGIAFAAGSLYIGSIIKPFELLPSPMLLASTISMALTGLFVIVTRIQALSQIIGYLVLENSTYLLGVSLATAQPLLVDVGVLLDVVVCVFIMGVVIHHINNAFDSISTESLEVLKK